MIDVKHIEDFVVDVFKDDVDKAGAPYILHCKFVANLAQQIVERYPARFKSYEHPQIDAYVVGLMHDVIEDHPQYTDMVKKLVSQQQFKSIMLLTRDNKVKYSEYIDAITTDPIAIAVKAADAHHNSLIDRFSQDVVDGLSHDQFKQLKDRCAKYKKRSDRLLKLL